MAFGISVLGQRFYHINSWFSFVISGSAFVFIYILVIWNLVMNNEEKELVMSVVNKIRK